MLLRYLQAYNILLLLSYLTSISKYLMPKSNISSKFKSWLVTMQSNLLEDNPVPALWAPANVNWLKVNEQNCTFPLHDNGLYCLDSLKKPIVFLFFFFWKIRKTTKITILINNLQLTLHFMALLIIQLFVDQTSVMGFKKSVGSI